MRHNFDLSRLVQFLFPAANAVRARGLDMGTLEDRVLYSATPLDLSALDTDDPNLDDSNHHTDLADDAPSVDDVAAPAPDEGTAPDSSNGLDTSALDDHLDPYGNEYHALTDLPTLDADVLLAGDPLVATASPFALSQTFLLNSNPGANHTIYLDFDGHVTSGTYWNSSFNGGNDIHTAAYDFDGNSSSFSDAELERIQYIWQRVAEDFSPFDVNVTTQDPGLDALIKSGGSDTTWGTRVVIGGSSYDWYGSGAGGLAYVGSFNWNSDTPAFVFEQELGNGNEKYTAEAISHEVGHTLGLGHDGSSSSSYYSGHGSGDTGWAPIMGTGYYKNLTQWSRGEYSGANNLQDDLNIITSNNGFGYRVDDHGGDATHASQLSFSSSSVSGSGIIERNTDVDVFAFTTDGGLIDLHIDPFQRGPNLDLLVELYDSASQLILSSNPLGYLNATLNLTVSAGQYFLFVSGVGQGDPLNGGYSDYGSLGQYTITGTIAPSSADSVSIAADHAVLAEGNSGGTALTFTVTRSGNLSDATSVDYHVAGSGTHAAGTDDFVGGVLPSGTVTFAAGESSKTITVNVAGDLVVEADEDFTVTLSNAAGDTQIAGGSAAGTILNDDAPPPLAGITVTPTSGLVTDENGGTASFTVVLDYQPTANVNIYVTSLDTSEGTTNVSMLTFTTANWNVAQTVRVTGVDDTLRDGNVGYTVQLSAAQSTDANYNGLDADDVLVTNRDNEKGGKTGGGGGGGGKGKPKAGDLPWESQLIDTELQKLHKPREPREDGPRMPAPVRELVANHAEALRAYRGNALGAALRMLYQRAPEEDEA